MNHPLRLALLPLLAVLLMSAAACNPRTTPTESPQAIGFSCAVQGAYRGDAVAGTLQRGAAGLLTVTLHEPAALEGLTMTWNGETVTLQLLGVSWNVSPDALPQTALGVRLLDALDAVVYGKSIGQPMADGRLCTTGMAGDAAFTLYSDAATGALLSLEVPSEELTLTFSDFHTQPDN